ncbi:MAG: ABC transporter ATP-binding protein [Clostridia bacterium]
MIEVKNVTKKYGNFVAVEDISFTVKDGEVVGFLGPNGAGKSTTMNMITGFIEPTEGTIEVNGYDVLKKSAKAKKQIGYMPEGTPLYMELTVKEFVTYMAELRKVPKKERKEKVEKVLQETGIKEVEKKLIRNLSRGYKQRVSLAGALVGDPEVIILDEPTVGLDPKQITEIRQLIKDLGKKHTVILSSHILSEVSQICEKVVIINKGKIVAIDTPENLERKTQEKNVLLITVEDKNDYMLKIKDDIKDMLECKFIKDNEDGTKQYMIKSSANVDLRKQIFDILPKKEVTIFELKKAEKSLEDAFITLIDANTQERQEEEKKEQENKERIKEEAKKEKEAKKKDKDLAKAEKDKNKVDKPKNNKKEEKQAKNENKKENNSKENKKGGKE